MMRSLLFTPGNVAKMLAKGATSGAHVQIVDLEDSVPASAKLHARVSARQYLTEAACRPGPLLVARVNNVSSLLEGDIEAVCVAGLWGVTVGKIESREEMGHVAALVARRAPRARLLPWIETARGVENALQIATASPSVAGLLFGADDYRADMGVERDAEGVEGPLLLHARLRTAVAARAARVPAFDTPYVDIRNMAGLEAFIARSKAIGFAGACAIHPSHVAAINSGYAPSAAQTERAARIVAAFTAAGTSGRGSLSVDGQMVDVPVFRAAVATLQRSNSADPQLVGELLEQLDK